MSKCSSQRSLNPPRLQARAEVRLRPRGHGDVAVDDGGVRQRQGQWRRATHHLAVLVVLRAMARAAELVRSPVPRHDTAQVRAHGADAKVLDAILRGDDVRGLALQALHELAVVVLMRLLPALETHRGASLAAADRGAATAAAHV